MSADDCFIMNINSIFAHRSANLYFFFSEKLLVVTIIHIIKIN